MLFGTVLPDGPLGSARTAATAREVSQDTARNVPATGQWLFAPWRLCPDPPMTSPNPPDDVRSTEEFETYLTALIEASISNGVDPRGAWEFRPSDGQPDFEIEIVELDGQYTDD